MGIPCDNCGSDRNIVIDSRYQSDEKMRRRKCSACGHRFTTYEAVHGKGGAQAEVRRLKARVAELEGRIERVIEVLQHP